MVDDKTKIGIGRSTPELPPLRVRKRMLEEDSLPMATSTLLSGGVGDAQTPGERMLRSTSPATNTHFTKTGRVSKAAKGMPVHHCDCGKTYTRAEHLRRHQQNHKPGTFSCDFEGCERAFSREDLLIRHKAKHNELSESSETLMSRIAQTRLELNGTFQSSPHCNAPTLQDSRAHVDLKQHQSSPSRSESVHETNIHIRESQQPNLITDADVSCSEFPEQHDWSADLPLLHYFGNEFPLAEYPAYPEQIDQFPLTLETDHQCATNTTALNTSHSPASARSILPTSFWRGSSPNLVQPYTPASDHSLSKSRSRTDLSTNSSVGGSFGMDTELLPEHRDLLEQDQLVTPTSAPQNFGVHQYHHRVDNEQRYLDAYWRLVHPAWSVIHKPTFDVSYASPLLRSAMLTLGACYTGNQIDSANACILHKRCLKVIKSRTINNSHSYRICDMQAILLVEIFSTYRSRRPPLELSKPFQDNYCTLASHYDIDTTSAFFTDFHSPSFPQELSTITFRCESKQRLLAAYYILDQEQAILFGRPNTVVPDFLPANLSLPQPMQAWDSDAAYVPGSFGHADDWHYQARGSLGQVSTSLPHLGASTHEPFDEFMASLALAYSTSDTRVAPLGPQNPVPDLGRDAPTLNPIRVELARQTLALCSSTPIRALLATAGESWVMAEKLSLPADYSAAQNTVRAWTVTSADAAFARALEIIRLHRLYPKTTCLYHEWSLHLASLAVWAYTYARRSPKTLRLSIPSSTSPASIVRGHELDKALANLAQTEVNDNVIWDDTKCVLSWARSRIEKTDTARFCGVVSGAVDVLKVLVTRGDEEDWF